jgi:hypothetical protein
MYKVTGWAGGVVVEDDADALSLPFDDAST